MGLPARAAGQHRGGRALGVRARLRRPAPLHGGDVRLALGHPHLHAAARPGPALRTGHRAGAAPAGLGGRRGRVAASEDRARLDLRAAPAAARTRRRPSRPRCRLDPPGPPSDTIRPSRAPLFTSLLLRVAQPWKPGSTYVVEIDSLRNANLAAANIRGPLEVPVPKVDTTAADSLKAAPDSAVPTPDSLRPAPPGPDSLQPKPPAR